MTKMIKGSKFFVLIFLGWHIAGTGWSQNYPSKIVRYVVTDSPGGLADALGRIVTSGLTEIVGQQVIVENRTGAGGNIGASYAAKAPADGYTLLQISQTHTANATYYRNLPYDLLRDFSAVTQIGSAPAMLVVHPSLPVKSISELVKLAKAKPGAISYASAGAGTTTFTAGELFKAVAGIDMLHIPYRGGGEAITSLISGQTPVYFAPLSGALPQVRSGRLRALGVTGAERLSLLPELPTVAEAGYPGFACEFWYGLMVPAKTPKDIITMLRGATVSALQRPETKKRMQDIGLAPRGDLPEEFTRFIGSEIEKWGQVIRSTGLTAD
jgi:tripartite-type tricarboxylate transporter receptor subunit TctC